MNKRNMVWMFTGPKPVTLKEWDKYQLKKAVEAEIEKVERLKTIVSKVTIKAGRIYLHYLFEPKQIEGVQYTVPLIDGKYIELVLARITVFDNKFTRCSLDYQCSDNKWMGIGSGTLAECIQQIETCGWFDV
jgi:hypothetical protein